MRIAMLVVAAVGLGCGGGQKPAATSQSIAPQVLPSIPTDNYWERVSEICERGRRWISPKAGIKNELSEKGAAVCRGQERVDHKELDELAARLQTLIRFEPVCSLPLAKPRGLLRFCQGKPVLPEKTTGLLGKLGTQTTAPALTPQETAAIGATELGSLFVQGLAAVVEKRAKAEFRRFIAKRIRSVACGDAEIARFLTHVCVYLGGDETAFALSLGPGMRQAFVDDIENLPSVLRVMLESGDVKTLWARVAVEVIDALRHSGTAGHVGAALRLMEFTCTGCKETHLGVQIAGALVEAATRKPAGQDTYIDALSDGVKEIANESDDPLKRKLNALGTRLGQKATQIERLYVALALAKTKVDEVLSADGDDERLVAYAAFVRAAIDAVVIAVEVASDAKQAATVRARLAPVALLATAIAEKSLARVLTAIAALAAGVDRLPAKATRLLSFGVELAAAKTPEEAEAAIEAVAAPAGAWQLKLREFTVAVTGFVGLGAHHERVKLDGNDQTGVSFSPVGIVGLDASVPVCRKKLTLGLTLSVLDVGALMSYWASDDEAGEIEGQMATIEEVPPLGVEQAFSPGLYVRIGHAWDLPFVLGVGGSVVPNGREIEVSGDEQAGIEARSEGRSVVRFSAFLAVDVTLFPF